jgi:hypothetical protein
LPATAFPAAFPEVIAVAATHAADGPWRFSGIGRLVDIAAPGEGVWRAAANLVHNQPDYTVTQGTGTSFATACVAGLAALWLSFHGGRRAIADKLTGELWHVPYAFQLLLARTANNAFDFVREAKYGAGIADAERLLSEPLPSKEEVERFAAVIKAQPIHKLTFISGLFSGGMGVSDRPAVTLSAETTRDANGQLPATPVEETDAVERARKEQEAETALLRQLLGRNYKALSDELIVLLAADRRLLTAFQRWRQGESLLPLLDLLLGHGTPATVKVPSLSAELKTQLDGKRKDVERELKQIHSGKLTAEVTLTPLAEVTVASPLAQPLPAVRQLAAYAFDPSLATKLETARIHQVLIPTRWEHVEPGPIGEYLEVIDVDPASGCAYAPIDLNHPYVLAQSGLPPSEGNPQFHQQMVYAVAMNTIHRFELALGRPVFWSPLRPWLRDRPEERHAFTPEAIAGLGLDEPSAARSSLSSWKMNRTRYVQRLRIYPHALREANAYYSPTKRALLFGYFPGADDETGRQYPGGMVFTCLSHDIVAHETTHALLDGMHPYFNEPSNEDVWAFHEAFADIMALFQHFTYPEVLAHQIASTRGDLQTDNLLGQLAQQFGQTTSGRGALRSALGEEDERGRWFRYAPNPLALRNQFEPHFRGSILVAAVFDAFLAIYNHRVADLLRIYTGGTGVLPAGEIHPDLVDRLAREAAAAAEEVLALCIRAMDYVPPTDITFGEFLRALITADYDRSPDSGKRNRIAFIDAFRSWGIYPRNITTLSEESLRWHRPEPDQPLARALLDARKSSEEIAAKVVTALDSWQPGSARDKVFDVIMEAQKELHDLLLNMQTPRRRPKDVLPGLDFLTGASFSVGNLRLARRTGPEGEFRTEAVVEVVQTYQPPEGDTAGAVPFRGGATLVVDLRTWELRYIIYKQLYDETPSADRREGVPSPRLKRQRTFENQQRLGLAGQAAASWLGEDGADLAQWLAATYECRERVAARHKKKKTSEDEPFALLHRDIE